MIKLTEHSVRNDAAGVWHCVSATNATQRRETGDLCSPRRIDAGRFIFFLFLQVNIFSGESSASNKWEDGDHSCRAGKSNTPSFPIPYFATLPRWFLNRRTEKQIDL